LTVADDFMNNDGESLLGFDGTTCFQKLMDEGSDGVRRYEQSDYDENEMKKMRKDEDGDEDKG
jgi:hypothetical protein